MSLSFRSGWGLQFVIWGPAEETQAFAMGSGDLAEVDNELYLVLTSWLLGLRPQASFSGALHSESTFNCVQHPFLLAKCLC